MSSAIQKIAAVALLLVLQAAHVFAQTPQYTWRNVQIFGGGFIPGIVFNQTEPNLVYTRTDIGGAYRLDPTTNRWVPLLDSIGWDDWNLTGVISIATDAINPNNVYVAAGTYWHSTDSGASFVKLANVEEADNIGFGKAATGQTYMALYAVAQIAGVRGIFRSIDAGQTWVRINDNQHQWGRAGDTAITGDPRIFGRVYIGTNGRGIFYGDGQ